MSSYTREESPITHYTPEGNEIRYDEVVVTDEEIKYKKLSESQERHILRLESQIESLKEELAEVGNKYVGYVQSVEVNANGTTPTSSSLPQGIQLPSVFRQELESKLRQKALLKLEGK